MELPCGTPRYAAPETGEESYDAKAADVWSCGVTLYVMLLAEFPWGAASMECPIYRSYILKDELNFKWPEKLSSHLQQLLQGMLHPDPIKRWTVEQVLSCAWCMGGQSLRRTRTWPTTVHSGPPSPPIAVAEPCSPESVDGLHSLLATSWGEIGVA